MIFDKWKHVNNRKDVIELREFILNSFKDLEFNEEEHRYFLHGKELTSVSKVIERFTPEINWVDKAQGCFEKYFDNPISKYYQMTREMILNSWDENTKNACAIGHEKHNFGENLFYLYTYQFDKIKGNKPIEYYYNIPDDYMCRNIFQYWLDLPVEYIPILCETKVYDESRGYSGTFDILFAWDNGKPLKDNLLIHDYKGLWVETPILTKGGWKKMKDLTINDFVYDKNGELTKIKNVSKIHYRPCYKIYFDDNTSIISDYEHNWLITFIIAGKESEKIMTTKDLFLYLNKLKKRIPHKIPKIMVNKPLNNEEIYLPINPYILGLWLGDGSSQSGAFTNMNINIWEEINKCGYNVGEDISSRSSGLAATKTIFGLSVKLKELNLINNKHIPHIYLLGSYKQRLSLLQGIMDTDGYYNNKRKRYVLATTKEWYVKYLPQLLSTLGIKSTVISCKKYCNNKIINGYDICFTTEINPFLKRNQNITFNNNAKKYHKWRNIKEIKEIPIVPTKCIQVDSDTKTFLAGNELIITHNTNVDLFKNFMGQTMLPPFNNDLDMPISHYNIQLPMYQIPLENIGCNVIDRRLIYVNSQPNYQLYKLSDYTKILRNIL